METAGTQLEVAVKRGWTAGEIQGVRSPTYDDPSSAGQKLQVIVQVLVSQHLNDHINPLVLVTNRRLHDKRTNQKTNSACFKII